MTPQFQAGPIIPSSNTTSPPSLISAAAGVTSEFSKEIFAAQGIQEDQTFCGKEVLLCCAVACLEGERNSLGGERHYWGRGSALRETAAESKSEGGGGDLPAAGATAYSSPVSFWTATLLREQDRWQHKGG